MAERHVIMCGPEVMTDVGPREPDGGGNKRFSGVREVELDAHVGGMVKWAPKTCAP